MENKKYVVAANVSDEKDCMIAAADDMIIATHRVVFGPDTKDNCERWKQQNCK